MSCGLVAGPLNKNLHCFFSSSQECHCLEASISANFLVWNFLGHFAQGSDLGHLFFRGQFLFVCLFFTHSPGTHKMVLLEPLFRGISFSPLAFLYTEEASIWGSCLSSRVLFSTLCLMVPQGFPSLSTWVLNSKSVNYQSSLRISSHTSTWLFPFFLRL